MEQAKLENLYQTENGIVLPQTDDMVSNVRDDLVSVFGNGMRFDTKTPAGRILEYLARSFRSVLAVNAQNANQQNIYTATGRYLDGHGTIYNLPGVERTRQGSSSRSSVRTTCTSLRTFRRRTMPGTGSSCVTP